MFQHEVLHQPMLQREEFARAMGGFAEADHAHTVERPSPDRKIVPIRCGMQRSQRDYSGTSGIGLRKQRRCPSRSATQHALSLRGAGGGGELGEIEINREWLS